MNRLQFQPGLSMVEFMDRYGSDEQCEAALVQSRWPAGFVCPVCEGGHGSVRISVCEALEDYSTAAVGTCDVPTDAVGKSVVMLRAGLGETIRVEDRELIHRHLSPPAEYSPFPPVEYFPV